MAPPKNPPGKPAGKPKPYVNPTVAGIGKVANTLADKLPNAPKAAQQKMRGKPQGGAPRG